MLWWPSVIKLFCCYFIIMEISDMWSQGVATHRLRITSKIQMTLALSRHFHDLFQSTLLTSSKGNNSCLCQYWWLWYFWDFTEMDSYFLFWNSIFFENFLTCIWYILVMSTWPPAPPRNFQHISLPTSLLFLIIIITITIVIVINLVHWVQSEMPTSACVWGIGNLAT